MPVNKSYAVVVNASLEDTCSLKTGSKAVSQQNTSNYVVMLEAGIWIYWVELRIKM